MKTLFVSAILLAVAALPAQEPSLPAASWDHLPNWKGSNLLNRFHREWQNRPFAEADFALMAEFGFNFARLPIDYRVYTSPGDWIQFNETVLQNLDQAIAWANAHGVHIQLSLHRIPGFTVASPPESTSLWTDPAAQTAAAAHWSMFAARYRAIPNDRLSFNLLNEPTGVTAPQYFAVVQLLANAIRAQDPGRLIVADGLDYASAPVPELIPLQVAQAFHMYEPFNLTHYKASWVDGSDTWETPQWPGNDASSYLFGPDKPDLQSALVIDGPFPVETSLRIKVNVVSARSRLRVTADGATIYDRLFQPGPGEGDWTTVVYRPEWGIYQNIYLRDYFATIPAGTQQISIANAEGDWMTCNAFGLAPTSGGPEASFSPGNATYGSRQTSPITYRHLNETQPFDFGGESGRRRLWQERLADWVALKQQGVGIMAGEWGVHNQTPHATTLAWTRDLLEALTASDIGWAQWDFFGSFGPFDSGRPDVIYEPHAGRLLDRRMMDLLQEFILQRQSFQSWSEQVFFNSDVPPQNRGPQASVAAPDLPNLACYFHGIDPLHPNRAALPHLVPTPSPRFAFATSPKTVATHPQILTSSDLLNWSELPPETIVAEDQSSSIDLPELDTATFLRLALTLDPSR